MGSPFAPARDAGFAEALRASGSFSNASRYLGRS